MRAVCKGLRVCRTGALTNAHGQEAKVKGDWLQQEGRLTASLIQTSNRPDSDCDTGQQGCNWQCPGAG